MIRRLSQKSLLDCKVGKKMKIESILDQRSEFLNFAKNKSLMPGNIIKILKYQKIADTVEVQVEKNPSFLWVSIQLIRLWYPAKFNSENNQFICFSKKSLHHHNFLTNYKCYKTFRRL